ncbi:SDR family oxidoreductase [Pararoseomonas sp. SCSIO 73927]|uniref:SDR family oxidoreductase n=1 Tax=Pararoseomonas sp. SCSIO 73927 TaxID=3114537 RepID=UPI0038CF5D65
MAIECAGHGVTAKAIAPGRIDTPRAAGAAPGMNEEFARRISVGRMGLPEEIAAAALYLVGEHAGFVTGTTLDVNGGFFMA